MLSLFLKLFNNPGRRRNFIFDVRKPVCLPGLKKIILIIFFAVFMAHDPGAVENPGDVRDKLTVGNIRLTNSDSFENVLGKNDWIIRSFMDKWKIQGASLAVARDGKLAYARGFGFADTASASEVQPYSKFRIASISKLVTAVAIMKLHEEGRLDLSDRVFGPDGILNDSCYCYPKDKRVFDITVAHLLSHEGGWSQKYGDQMFMPRVVSKQMNVPLPVDMNTIIRFALGKRLHFTPGTGRSYSNLGYAILGLVVEKVSGMTYDSYCREEIFEPLGIYDMLPARNLESQKARFEVTYYEPFGTPPGPSIYATDELVPVRYGGNDVETLGGAGYWLATAPDLMRLLLAVDGFVAPEDILSNSSIRFMTDMANRFAPVGWKATLIDGNWWRTGSFSGSAGMMKRQPDGISWVILLNSSAWNGPEIHSHINRMMAKFIARTDEWPENDLFEYSLPVPVKVDVPAPKYE